MGLERVQRRSASEGVYEQLLGTLLSGEVGPGERLPAERTLTEVLGVNRQAVREALQRLAQAGLIEIRQGGSTRARDYRRSAGLDLLPRLLIREGDLDPAVARSIMEMRSALGVDVARMCARRANPHLAGRISQVVERMAGAGGLADRAALDLHFWNLMVEGSDNIAYRLAYNTLRRTYEPLEPVLREVLAEEIGDIEGHRRLARAIRDEDEVGAATAATEVLAKGTAAIAQALAALEVEEVAR